MCVQSIEQIPLQIRRISVVHKLSHFGVLRNGFDHFIADSHSVIKAWSEVLLDFLETITVSFKRSKGHAIRPCLRLLDEKQKASFDHIGQM